MLWTQESPDYDKYPILSVAGQDRMHGNNHNKQIIFRDIKSKLLVLMHILYNKEFKNLRLFVSNYYIK